MISKQEFSSAARCFLDELSTICLRTGARELSETPSVLEEIAEMQKLMMLPDSSDSSVLSLSFGVVDEFATRRWEDVVSQAYDSYSRLERTR
jgi:hypothetical protein